MKKCMLSLVSALFVIFVLAGYSEAFWFFDYMTHDGCRIVKIESKDTYEDTIIDTMSFTYDDSGNVVKMTIVEDNEKTVIYFTNDSDGNPEKLEFDWNDDGEANAVAYYIYDDDGNIERMEWGWTLDGDIDEYEDYIYDEGRLVRIETKDFESDELYEIEYFEYFPDGKLEKIIIDWNADGHIDYVEYWEYDDDGKLKKSEIDKDDNGTINEVGTPVWDCKFDQAFSGGDGTAENPYLVATAEDLDNVRHYLDAYFRQTADIDLGVVPWSEGAGWQPIGRHGPGFSGRYDGDGYVIANLTINQPEDNFIGLFGSLAASGQLRNLKVEDMDITGEGEVGGLVGYNSGTIDNCYTMGTVSAEFSSGGLVGDNTGNIFNSNAGGTVSAEFSSGGLVGENSGRIYNCYATVLVSGITIGGLVGNNEDGGVIWKSYATGDVVGEWAAGGLTAVNIGYISDCYAMGSVSGSVTSDWGDIYIGGLVGLNGVNFITTEGEKAYSGFVQNAYATGSVSGGEYVGGLIGSQGLEYDRIADEVGGPLDIGEVENSFWDEHINAAGVGFGDGTGAAGKSTIDMQTQQTFLDAGWAFDNIWTMAEGEYPYFQMEVYVPDIVIDYPFIQYRTYESEAQNNYRGWIEVRKNGKPIKEDEVSRITVKDADDNEVGISGWGYWPYVFYRYNCLAETCFEGGPDFGSGFYITFEGDLPSGQYWIEIETADGRTDIAEINYPGKLALPVVSSASMTSRYENGDLVFSWTNPAGEDNWNKVDRLRILLNDEMGREILYVEVGPDNQEVTIPADIMDTAEAIYGTKFTEWQVQTRAFDENWMDYARGLSDWVDADFIGDEMPRSVLSGEDQEIDITSDSRIIGTGASETLTIYPNINVDFTAGDGDRVNLPYELEHYEITSMGNHIWFSDVDANKVVTIIVTGTSTVGFADGSTATLEMVFSPGESPQVQLGGAVVGPTPLE